MVMLGIGTDELDHFPVTLDRFFPIAARLIHHAEPIVTVVHFREARQEITRRLLGRIELGSPDQIDDGVGGSRQLFLLQEGRFFPLEKGIELFALLGFGGDGEGESSAVGRLIFLQAAAFVLLSTATGAGIVATRLRHMSHHFTGRGEASCT